MKNKALTYLLVGILSLSLIGCGKKEETESVANVSEKEVVQEDINEPEADFIEDSEQEENIDEEVVEEISGINIKSQIVKDYLGGDYIEETEVINGVKYYVYPNGVVADIVEEDYSLFDEGEYNGKDIVLAIYGENQFCTNSTVIGINQDITLTTSESANLTEIPENIKYVESLDSNISGNLVIPDTVDIYTMLAADESDIETLTIGNNVTCLIGSKFTINPENINSYQNKIIYDEVYGRCENLKEATIPEGVGILYSTFFNCPNLEKVTLPSTITEIGGGAFMWCKNLKEITIPENTEIIGEGAFNRCIGLTEITIPEGVTTICDSAFSGCTSLTEIVLPDSITYFGKDVFYECENLTRLEVSSNIDDEIYTRMTNYYSSKLPNLEIVKR